MRPYSFAMFALTFATALLLFCSSTVTAQLATPAAGSAQVTTEQQPGPLAVELALLKAKVDDLQAKLDKTAESVNTLNGDALTYKTWGSALLWVLGALAAFVTIIFAAWQIRLGYNKPIDERMLEKGEKTISLVNEILDLTKESTDKAMKAAHRKIDKESKDLEQQVNDLMLFANKDDLDVVVKRGKNDLLKDLFSKLTLLDFANDSLDAPITPTPAWLFLRALKHSQESRCDEAIKQWRKIFSLANATPGLVIRSRYWVGHEQNNLGRFEDSEGTFEEAFAYAKGQNVALGRALELERLAIEAKLFRLSSNPGNGSGELIQKIDRVVKECTENNLDGVKEWSLRTKGDILYTLSFSAFRNNDKKTSQAYMRTAMELWKPLADQGINFAEREYAFACHALQENLGNAQQLLEEKVRNETKKLYTNSIRHRDKAYYAMIQLMVARAQGAESRAEDMDTRANFHVGEMHDSEHPYSPLSKCYVSREEFQKDIRQLSDKGLPVLV
jgi:tetratricopeptide (TPR) repeat protein